MVTDMDETLQAYTGERAVLLARLILTRKKGAVVHNVSASMGPDSGFDLLVSASLPDTSSRHAPVFGVQVMGTPDPLPDELHAARFANTNLKKQRKAGFFLFPTVVLIFSMEDDLGYYDWLLKPILNEDGYPGLRQASTLNPRKITKKAIEHIYSEAEEWYLAVEGFLLKKEAK
jgi:hypothetical protein